MLKTRTDISLRYLQEVCVAFSSQHHHCLTFHSGSGKAGRHVIPYLLAKGHKVLNLDMVPFPDPSVDVYTLKTDLTDSGQVFNALTSHFNMSGYSSGPVPSAPDVVIHFAGELYG